MKLSIDITDCQTKQEQIVKIFNTLMDNKLMLEAKIYSIVFAQMNKKKVVEELTYSYMTKVFMELNDPLPTKDEFEKALNQLKKVEVKYVDEKGRRRTTQLIKEVSNI